jgi:antitoxin MazE
MHTHIQKWGNSLGVRIPAKLAHQLNMRPGGAVDVFIEDDRLIVNPQRYQLTDLIGNISKSNMHHHLLESSGIGEEEW